MPRKVKKAYAKKSAVQIMSDESDGFENITWGTSPLQCASDHVSILLSLPKILDAYVGCNAMDPKTIESIMVAVNSVNNCPYCTGLHGELARMAGVNDPGKLMNAKTEAEARNIVNHESISFAITFAKNQGRGRFVDVAYVSLVEALGSGEAGCVRALCWFLFWGSTGGNTVNSFLFGRLSGKPKAGSFVLFEVLFFIYYCVLFGLIAVVNLMLQFFPESPNWFMALFGCVLWLIASVFIVPAGLISIIFSPCFPEGGKLKGRSDYKVNYDEVVKEYTTFADYTMFFPRLESDERHAKDRMGYTDNELKHVPEKLWKTICGGGNHFNYEEELDEKYRLKENQFVVDFGSGTGVDCLIAANMVGGQGKVIGVDMTPRMVERGQTIAQKENLDNLSFNQHQIDGLMLSFKEEHAEKADRIISNGVFNLCENKAQLCQNAFKLLKPDGIIIFSDFLITPMDSDQRSADADVIDHTKDEKPPDALWID